MAQIRRGYADGPFGQVHFRDTGGGGMPVIFCHQAPMSSLQFQNIYPMMAARGWRALGIDYPGFGQSDPPPAPPTVPDYAAALLAVMDHLGLSKVHLVGHHTGSMVVTHAAVTAPEKVGKVVLHGPVPLEPQEVADWMPIVDKEKAYIPVRDGSHFIELWQARQQWMPADFDPDLLTRYLADQVSGSAPFWYGHNAAFTYDHGATLKQLTQPVLNIVNSGDMVYEFSKRAQAMRPDFTWVEIGGGSIDIPDELPEPWIEAIDGFLKS